MPKTTTTCPRCRQPVLVEVEQLFDLNVNPRAKQNLLSGAFNRIRCPSCSYEGTLSTPVVYHDPEKQLLFTYFPASLGLPINEQERLIGPLITQVTNKLPPEKRKAYLLRPQTMLTMETMIERILEADGITKSMIQAQQQRLILLQRLLSAPADQRAQMIHSDDALIDAEFFALFSRVIEGIMAQGDQQSAQQIAALQQDILENSTYGKELHTQAKEAEKAIQALQEAGKDGLTREKLLDLILESPSDVRLNTLVNVARQGIDYNFFEILTRRIEAANGEKKRQLEELRDRLLTMTQEIDRAVQEQVAATQEFLNGILASSDIEKAMAENLEGINDLFVQIVQAEFRHAQEQGNRERLEKLQRVIATLNKYSTPPPEIALIETLLEAKDENSRQKLIEEHAADITPEFLQMLANLAYQSNGQSPEMAQQLTDLHRQALRYSMKANLKK
ncbi:MAG TPA: CpXC domain-containing protein [Levilinea sp.]|nr:CpXC domain-containing protein [Levilinea sp.]